MKTLVVLSALVAVALTAPALFEEGSEDFKNIITNVPDVFKRERKATLESSSDSNPTSGLPANLPSTSQISELGVSGRSFGLKKPIIIKKKQGYHVYRDSDEEQAESGESCGKQVKVKLCDVKSDDKMRSSNVEDVNTHMTDEDMKHSIQLAKEAVENLQRDFKTVEHTPGPKKGQDVELHQDIEVAREALEHIHKNFGNLETMSIHATKLEDADTVHDTHFAIARNEEQRLAQWKEAIDTIQRNVEIAKNIEDSFKQASGETGLLFLDNTKVPHTNNEPNQIVTDHFMRTTAEDMVAKDENKVDSENCQNEHEHEKSSEKDKTKGVNEDDMTSAASTISEKKIEDFHNSENSKHSGLPIDSKIEKALKSDKSLQNAPKEKDADQETMILQDLTQNHNLVSESMKTMDEKKERKTELELKDKKSQLTESTENISPKTMKSVESEDILFEQMRNAETPSTTSTPLKMMKFEPLSQLQKLVAPDKKHPEAKSAEHFDENNRDLIKDEEKTWNKQFHSEQPKQVVTTMFVKSAQQSSTNVPKQFLTSTKTQENAVHKDHHFAEAKMSQFQDLNQKVEPTNNAEHHHKQSFLHPEMREVDDLKHVHQLHLMDPSQTRWAEDKNFHLQTESMKSADNFNSQTMDHAQKLQHAGHHHHLAHSMQSQHFDTPNGHEQLHSRFPDNFMVQGKSADADMMSYYMSMREGSDGHRFRWKPTHEASRNAYGAPSAPAPASAPSGASGGAVGVFPNANIGACGIPLLLSCNPSVVSGSLANPHPAPYSAPAYRTEDEFNFHTKRDVKKTHPNVPNSLNRTPANTKPKTSTVLVAKQ